MRWWLALALAAGASTSAVAKPTLLGPTTEIWGPTLIAEMLHEDGFVVIALTQNDCVGCKALNHIARRIDAVDYPGRWHVHVVYAEGYVDDAHELLPGSPLPILVLAHGGIVLAARNAAASVEEAEAWLAASARRTQHIAGGPLGCTQRMIDLLVAPGRLGAKDLIRYATLRTGGAMPYKEDPLVEAWGVLASFSVIDLHARSIELGDLAIDTRAVEPRVLVVDRPTHPDLDAVNGTLVDDTGETRGSVKLTGSRGSDDLAVLRPIAGTFCRGG